MTSQLDNLCGPGKPLRQEPFDQREFDGLWRMLSKCHDKRNVAEYEGVLDVDERLVADLLTAAHAVERSLKNKAGLD